MRNRPIYQPVALLLCMLLVSPVASPLSAAGPAAVGRIVSTPVAAVNGVHIPDEGTLFSGDRLTTGAQGWARVLLPQGEQIHLAAQSEARATRQSSGLEVELVTGRLTVQARGENGINVRSNGLEIQPAAATKTVWEVARLGEGVTQVTAFQGAVEVRASNRTVEVMPGQSMRVEASAPAADQGGGAGAGAGLGTGAKVLITLAVIAGLGLAVGIPVAIANQGQEPISPSGL